MDERLTRFIDHARQQGLDHSATFLLLRSSGWKERQIAQALAARDLSLPIPERVGMGSARDAFLHLLAFTALYASAISLVLLSFTYIEFWFPDPEMRTSTYAAEAALSVIRAHRDPVTDFSNSGSVRLMTLFCCGSLDLRRSEGECLHGTGYNGSQTEGER